MSVEAKEGLVYIVEAADGNATAIQIFQEKTLEECHKIGSSLIGNYKKPPYNVEQAGILLLNDDHFEMSGGEFCGNASRAVSMLLANYYESRNVGFTISGFERKVEGKIEKEEFEKGDKIKVKCFFPDYCNQLSTKEINLSGDKTTIVDMGGIVHVLIDSNLPEDYEIQHQKITQKLGLENRSAVGVDWLRETEQGVYMDPVVWVNNGADNGRGSFFYEGSCGSGSIAAALVKEEQDIFQPSGEKILVKIEGNDITLTSNMEITHVI
ncbi:MAG: hypothetical protein ABEJ24_04705 [Candidatus Magasanikbacteria bacterium]